MTDTKHTPGLVHIGNDGAPYHWWSGQIIALASHDGGGEFVMATCNQNYPELSKANAARLSDCWNACSGMTDPAAEIAALRAELERKDAHIRELETYINEHYTAAATAYIKELEALAGSLTVERDEWKANYFEIVSASRKAIAELGYFIAGADPSSNTNQAIDDLMAATNKTNARAAIEEE